MWIDENATNEVMETMFKGQLRIEAMQNVPKTLYTEIAKNAVLDNIQDEKYPVHYYKGMLRIIMSSLPISVGR